MKYIYQFFSKISIQIIIFLIFIVSFSDYNVVFSLSSKDKIEPLPEIFYPINWDINLKKIHSLFSSFKVVESEYQTLDKVKTKAITINGMKREYFKESSITIEHENYKKIKRIFISTVENRLQCDLYTNKSIPHWCRNQYNTELISIFKNIKNLLVHKYGKPVYDGKLDNSSDKREKRIVWKRKGYNLFLQIDKGEQNDWVVTLIATRSK